MDTSIICSKMTILAILFILLFQKCGTVTISEKLKNDLMKGYDNSIRPVYNETEALVLNITLNSMSVLMLDPSEETVYFSAEFILQWKDEFLTWNRSDFNVTWIKLREQMIWLPDTTVSSSIDTTFLLDPSERYISLKYDGTVRQSMYAVFTNLCDMNVNNFPYDKQTCVIKIGPWSYTKDEIRCISGDDIDDNSTYFTGNSEWDFEGITSNLSTSIDPDVNFTYSEVHFFLNVKRRPQFYVWVLLIPTYIITVICIFGLFSPTANNGLREERVNLGITTLLSSAVILQIVASSMPKTSELPLLGNFILAEIFVVAAGVLCAVLILMIHQRSHTREWRPPKWLLWILRMSGSRKFLSKNKGKLKRKSSDRMKINYIGECSSLIQNLDDTLFNIREQISQKEDDQTCEKVWMKFFDRLDFLFLIIFQVGNALVTVFLVKT